MARIRTIKPTFFSDELVASWPLGARLAYVALWIEADDEGRLRAGWPYLRAMLFPYDEGLDVRSLLAPVVLSRRLLRYRVEGQTYGYLPKFKDHQRIDHPARSRLPEFSPETSIVEADVEEALSSRETREDAGGPREVDGAPRERSREEGKGREGKGREGREPSATSISRETDANPREALAKPEPLALLAPDAAPSFDPEALLALWNAEAPRECPRARALTATRERHARARLSEHPDPAFWREAIAAMGGSRFLRGAKGWKASLDWLLRPDSAVRLVEGGFADRGNGRTGAVRAEDCEHDAQVRVVEEF